MGIWGCGDMGPWGHEAMGLWGCGVYTIQRCCHLMKRSLSEKSTEVSL